MRGIVRPGMHKYSGNVNYGEIINENSGTFKVLGDSIKSGFVNNYDGAKITMSLLSDTNKIN